MWRSRLSNGRFAVTLGLLALVLAGCTTIAPTKTTVPPQQSINRFSPIPGTPFLRLETGMLLLPLDVLPWMPRSVIW